MYSYFVNRVSSVSLYRFLFCWWLMAKKNLSPIKVMLLLVVIAFVGVLLGFFNPGLSY
ncbi:PTS system mannose/fructose/sorbose family transporter subunit IID [Streptococcus sp.]|uniref:PTS system mannose/fructose/sorbose family transporter subunit IID n=1 Tax=Streptococcus sp. TaxID=1306 RepID=UPI00391A7105